MSPQCASVGISLNISIKGIDVCFCCLVAVIYLGEESLSLGQVSIAGDTFCLYQGCVDVDPAISHGAGLSSELARRGVLQNDFVFRASRRW